MKSNYLSVIYDLKRTPKTDYPYHLIKHLKTRFNIKPNSKVLEIGCGRCDFLNEFFKNGYECYGIDREIIENEDNSGLILKKVDISTNKFPFPDEYFDVVYHKSVIEHLYYTDNLMNESLRVLKKNGKLIILTPDWISQMKNFYEDYTHVKPFTVNAVNDLFNVYNLKNIKTELFYQLPCVWKYPFLKVISKFLSIFLSVYLARKITKITKIKFFRWSVELMILGYAEK